MVRRMSGGFQTAFEVIGAVAVAALSSFTTLIVSRKPAQMTAGADVQKAINEGFRVLATAYEERDRMLVEHMDAMDRDIQALTVHVGDLEDALRKNGLAVPQRPSRTPRQPIPPLRIVAGGKR